MRRGGVGASCRSLGGSIYAENGWLVRQRGLPRVPGQRGVVKDVRWYIRHFVGGISRLVALKVSETRFAMSSAARIHFGQRRSSCRPQHNVARGLPKNTEGELRARYRRTTRIHRERGSGSCRSQHNANRSPRKGGVGIVTRSKSRGSCDNFSEKIALGLTG
jgi:hypothetical protein